MRAIPIPPPVKEMPAFFFWINLRALGLTDVAAENLTEAQVQEVQARTQDAANKLINLEVLQANGRAPARVS